MAQITPEQERWVLKDEEALSLIYRRLELAREAGESHASFAVGGVIHREIKAALGYRS